MSASGGHIRGAQEDPRRHTYANKSAFNRLRKQHTAEHYAEKSSSVVILPNNGSLRKAQTPTRFLETTPPASWRVALQTAEQWPSKNIRNSPTDKSSRSNSDQSNSTHESASNGNEQIDKRNKASTGSKT